MMATLAQVGSLFTVPGLAAAGVALVAIPIAIHLLSRFRRKRQSWGAMRFVWEAYRKHKRRLQMEQWLLLAVRCLMVAVLGLALAGPVLTGCSDQLRAMGLLQGASRTVHVVIDDSLSTRALGANGAQRFETLRSTALAVIDAAGPGDEVVVWSGSGAGSELSAQSEGGGGAGARERVEAMRPGYGAAGMGEAVGRVASAIEAQAEGARGRRPMVVLISDWSRSSIDAQRVAPSLPGAEVVASSPLPGAANMQVMLASPRRQVVVAGQDGGASVPVEVRLRRFGAGEAVDAGLLRVALLDTTGRELTATQRRVTFPAGQGLVTFQETLRLSAEAMARAGGPRPVLVHAAIEPAAHLSDALAADDGRYATVELRRRLRVGLMGEGDASAAAGGSPSALTAGRWLSLALSPRMNLNGGPMEVSPITAAELGVAEPEALSALDVVMVTRPDELSAAAWTNLARFAEAGGLVWLVTPSEGPSALWARSLRSAFDVDWQVAIEPVDVGEAGRGAGVVLEDAPPALSMLAADWETLLRPVRVYRWLPLWTQRAAAWVALDLEGDGAARGASPANLQAEGEAAGGGASTAALLAFHQHGEGALLVMSAALDVAWTNLPTKPAFVPLVHEALRGVVGREPSPAMTVDEFAASGGEGWTRLALGPQAADEAGATLPGVYVKAAADDVTPVNVDADAGDTRALEEAALAAWLDGVGPWRLLDPADPAAALRAAGEGAPNLGWPLLWALLALVLLETVLARTLSHAGAERRRGLAGAVLDRLRRLHRADHDDQRRAA